MTALPPFDSADLATAIEALTAAQLDQLPYGVTGLDCNDVVRVYNRAEAEQSGRGARPTQGLPFFVDIAPCFDNGYFEGRIDKARAAGTLDISFTFVGDFADRSRELNVRVQSAKDASLWIFHLRNSP